MARGRSPWVWGGGALILGIPWPGIDLPILGVVPVLFLMFFVRPTAQRTESERPACSRCASPHTPSQNFCTKCGWELNRQYTPDNNDTVLASEMHQGQSASTATVERPTEPSAPETVAPTPSPPEQPSGGSLEPEPHPGEVVGEIASETATKLAQEDAESVEPTEAPAEPVADPEPASEPAPPPWGLPVPGPAPTAARMTARGAELLSQGKLQEAIDQFTKAIALDPRHRDAFERRAAAYSQQGREDRAQEDLQMLHALNTGS